MTTWIGLPEIVDKDTQFAIIYKITNTITGKMYVGKKQLWSKITRPPLKGKKRKRIEYKVSDFESYYGSSEQLKEDIKLYGKENFKREVLDIASCKWDAAYSELLHQLMYNAIMDDTYLNGIINIRLIKMPKHLHEKYKNFKMTFSLDNQES